MQNLARAAEEDSDFKASVFDAKSEPAEISSGPSSSVETHSVPTVWERMRRHEIVTGGLDELVARFWTQDKVENLFMTP